MAIAEEIERQRPGSTGSEGDDDSVDTCVDEFAPLLADGTDRTLYRTISVGQPQAYVLFGLTFCDSE